MPIGPAARFCSCALLFVWFFVGACYSIASLFLCKEDTQAGRQADRRAGRQTGSTDRSVSHERTVVTRFPIFKYIFFVAAAAAAASSAYSFANKMPSHHRDSQDTIVRLSDISARLELTNKYVYGGNSCTCVHRVRKVLVGLRPPPLSKALWRRKPVWAGQQ